MTDADRLAVVEELLAMPRSYRCDLTPVYDYRDEVLERLRRRDTQPAPAAFEDEPPTKVEGLRVGSKELADESLRQMFPGPRKTA